MADEQNRPVKTSGMTDHQLIDDYITEPTKFGAFANVVERNVVFEAEGAVFQVRLQRSAQHDYALLNRWSAGKEDWSIVAKRRPSEYGIQGYGPNKFDPEAFAPVINDLIDMAYDFEGAFQRQRQSLVVNRVSPRPDDQ